MKITCQSCQSKYTVSDDKVQGKTVKIKCRKCGSTIVVSSNGVTTSNGAGGGGADAQATAAGTYLVNVTEGDQRSMTLQEIVDAYNSSVVTADTYVWADGMADWAPLGQVEAITSALNSPAPMAEAPRVAARREPGRHAQDLFSAGGGGTETQSAADDVATSAPLFAKGSAGPAKPKPGEENSMLFSLSALTAKAAPAGASGAKGPANTEDSGIIDLKALAAAAEARAKSQAAASTPPPASGLGALMPEEGGLFLAPPVLSAAPAAPAVVAPIEMPQKNRTPLFIGIGATVAVAAIVGAFMVMKGGPEAPPVAASESAPTVAPTPTPPPEPTPPPVVEAAPTATASASAVAAKGTYKPPAGGGKAPVGGTTAKSPAGGTPPAGGGAAPAPAPKKGNCGCAPGDLMCAMKCSTK
jgi:predicted Zn finger-like uncharacterized protein